ncbi:RICIN domain-containing protein [Streptomyces sp. NBC_01351]|uniref:RICIN domain-containing protein n=1 Tax=Streptomyces sp. NBC_01351 TaxID=2903833 RepID=UPI002E33F4EF|nr:ricin-type beta-trefoil lectin domain protein [Streptomyces sp. NBC_01351]
MRIRLAAAAMTLALVGAVAPGLASPAGAADFFEIHTDLDGRCLTSNGDNVEVRNCAGGVGSQLWFWEGRKLRNLAERHCLDVRNGELNAAAQVVGDCHGQANQRWDVVGRQLATQVNNQCLSIQNAGDPSQGAGINVRNCTGAAWQRWDVPLPPA